MLKNFPLSTKIYLVLGPLFIATVSLSVYLNYKFQERLALGLLQETAEGRATFIKRTLVHMMTTTNRVEDEYLNDINSVGEVQNLQVLFRFDSLRLDPELLTQAHVRRLKGRELPPRDTSSYAHRALGLTKSMYITHCDLLEHPDEIVRSFTAESSWFSWCERLKIYIPFEAERRCLECHFVSEGTILGAASMEIPLFKTAHALRQNAIQSLVIFLAFSIIAVGLGILIFRKYVSQPVSRLVKATKIIGTGDLSHELRQNFDRDEFGDLAGAFQEMQKQLKAAQVEIIQKERFSAVGQMASRIIHDLRSPMTAISLGINMMASVNLSEDKKREMREQLGISFDRMRRMTQELLDFSRGEIRIELSSCNVHEFLETVARDVRESLEQKRIHLALSHGFDGNVMFDRDRMERALLNLLSNAEEATPTNGSIRIESLRDHSSVFFRVSDTGEGIPESIRETLFLPFVTEGKQRGTGLGLAITKEIVEEHGGQISFQQDGGSGTTFIIRIPLREPELPFIPNSNASP